MIARAHLRHVHTSPQKARLVVDQIRNRGVNDALSTLRHHKRAVARDLEKLLRSAVANATVGDEKVDPDNLVVSRATVDTGPTLKRSRHRAMGRLFRIIKRTSHITLELDALERPHGRRGRKRS
ncbi:MAG: 50S ribosomal protein L22 [Acidobacteriota bacterium]